MKNKLLIVISIILFSVVMIILSNYLNNMDKVGVENKDNNIVEENKKVEIPQVTIANFEEEVLNSDKTVLIDFYADWCGPCKAYAPIVEAFATENEDIKVVKVNVDDSEDLAIKYNAMSIPTTVVIKNGKVVNRAVGIISKSNLAEIVK